MCGIFGFFSRSPVKPNRVFDCLRHRGPDDLGGVSISVRNNSIRHYTFEGSNFESQQTIYFSENTEIDPEVLFLGHRRLSIIDRTAAGHQPMALDGYCITFNGEIYNQLELREELEKEGIEFKGNSDTEVLLRSYIHYGEDCLHRFNGKWAFAIWDPKKKNLLLSRDRYGKKQLFYFFDGSHFAFASEIKALLLLPFVPKSPNLEQVKYFLTWRSWEHRHQTMFEGVQRVLPAHNLWFDPLQNNLEVRRYYSITPNLSLEPFSELKAKEYVEAGERLFLDAVRIRLKGGLPIGASFSGGVDSSGIVFARERLSEKETSLFIRPSTYTFSSVYETNELKKYDESKWIDFALEKSQAIGIKVEPRPERFIEEALKIAYHQDEPFDSTGIFAGWCVMSLARQHGVIVTLDGQGPDEALGGYPPHIPIGFSELLLNFKLIRFFQKLSNFSKIENFSFLNMLRTIFMGSLGREVRHRIYARQLGKLFKDGKIPDYEGGSLDARRFLNEKLKYDVEEGLPRLLRFVDRNAMAFSLEPRTPWVDYRLIDFFFSIPSCYKTYDGWTKWIERKMLESFVPKEIIWRRDKLGFPTPEREWLSGPLNLWGQDLIQGSDIIKSLEVTGQAINGELRWKLISVALWETVFFKSAGYSS